MYRSSSQNPADATPGRRALSDELEVAGVELVAGQEGDAVALAIDLQRAAVLIDVRLALIVRISDRVGEALCAQKRLGDLDRFPVLELAVVVQL